MSLDYVKHVNTLCAERTVLNVKRVDIYIYIYIHTHTHTHTHTVTTGVYMVLEVNFPLCDSVKIPTRCSLVIEFIIPLIIRSSKTEFAASGLCTHVATGRCQGLSDLTTAGHHMGI